MTTRSLFALCALLCVPAALAAQHTGGAAPARMQTAAPREATQFDFLIGQWALTVRPQASGLAARLHGTPRLTGLWKAWRAFDGWGIEDELRIVDGSGNPVSLTHALRTYDLANQRWTQAVLDVYRGRFTTATAVWQNGEMQITSRGTDQEGRPTLSRTRFYDITPTSFRYQNDRSTDDGRTWDEAVLRIEARRTAATAPR